MNDSVIRLKISGVEYDLDMSELTFGELELIEKESGKSLSDLDTSSATTMLVLAWLAKRRREPLTTLDEMRMLPLSAIEAVEDPTPAVDADGAESVPAGELGNQS